MKISPEDHTDTILWESSNEAIATVNENGVVTPLATGSVKITAKALGGNKKATCTVTVAKEPEGIMLDGASEIVVAQGKSATLKAYAYYEENGKIVKTKDTIEWASADESVVTVSKGKVKGVGAGTTIITAYIKGTDISAEFEVSVVAPIKSLKFSPSSLEAFVGDAIDLNDYIIVTPFEHTDIITWESSDEDVATVEDGIITINGEGKVKITAKALAGGKKATINITAKYNPVGD